LSVTTQAGTQRPPPNLKDPTMTTAKYRHALPQMTGTPCLTDGGLETTLVFHDGFDLPLFAAFPLLETGAGRDAMDRYIRRFCQIAVRDGKGFILDTPTWRASSRWGEELGYSTDALKAVHARAIEDLAGYRAEFETPTSPFVINGLIGPQDDGYNPQSFLSVDGAKHYHADQVAWFKDFGADMVSALTLTYASEAAGIALAAKEAGMPCVLSFTVETDGRLPSGQTLAAAIEEVDEVTGVWPAYYMINCAHPDHFINELRGDGAWKNRIMGLRANASRMSHEELDNAQELDEGNPAELGTQYKTMTALLPNLTVMGGCCGTDHKHIDAISAACRHARAA
jgi:S-methylmethionine-dependent homocysteine/selenocysteine methylase